MSSLQRQKAAFHRGVSHVEDLYAGGEKFAGGEGEDVIRIVAAEAGYDDGTKVGHEKDMSVKAAREGVRAALLHLEMKGLIFPHVHNPKRNYSEKQLAAQARSRAVLKRAHAILASRGCSFKDAMVAAWEETKVKKNTGRGMTPLWRQAMDGNQWAQYEAARQGLAYNVPNMYANGRKTRRNSPTRGKDALWLAAYDGQPWAQFEMARTGRSYNVPNMWAGQAYANPGLKKGQNIMKQAAKRYRAGEFDSMQEAVSAVAAERRGR
jgi:hypothetical protein